MGEAAYFCVFQACPAADAALCFMTVSRSTTSQWLQSRCTRLVHLHREGRKKADCTDTKLIQVLEVGKTLVRKSKRIRQGIRAMRSHIRNDAGLEFARRC